MWSLYEKEKFLEPLIFSNGKSQEDVVREVLEKINNGDRVIFIRGACGTGKSAIALNLAKELGKSSIVVPGKNLQRQYKKDYEENKYVLKKSGEKLKISVITGRNNHKCKFLQDNSDAIPLIKREVNSKLHDIFSGRREEVKNLINNDLSADNKDLPCKIEIKEKNWDKIKKYLKQNKLVDASKLNDLKDVKRVSVASLCPYWSPVFKSKYEMKSPIFKDAEKRSYVGLGGNDFIFYQRKRGCPFYEQFNSFIDADVIVFNSQKYKLETVMNRKPLTEVEIIDECDEFLDSFSNQKTINLDRLQNSMIQIVKEKEDFDEAIKEMFEIIKNLKDNQRIKDSTINQEIIALKETGIYDLLKIIIKNPESFEEIDDESYLFNVAEVAETFKEMMDETYVSVEKKDNNLIFNLVAVNLAKRFNELVEKNKCLVLMSGTLHANEVLKSIFGIEKFSVLEAEGRGQGEIKIKRTGNEKNFSYANFSNGNSSREDYLKSLNKCVKMAKKPTLIHINAFQDMPSRFELKEFELGSLISRDDLFEMQQTDKEGKLVDDFKKGYIDVLFSTRASRGVDFPGEQCNSIVFTKYPNPNVQDPFWKILYKTKPQHYWGFYKDKAKRELWQKIYRGLRFKEDIVEVWSPDERVLNEVENDLRNNSKL